MLLFQLSIPGQIRFQQGDLLNQKFGAFLFLGFGLAAFLGVSSIGAATFGLIAAVIYYTLSGNKAKPALVNDDESEEL